MSDVGFVVDVVDWGGDFEGGGAVVEGGGGCADCGDGFGAGGREEA